MNFFIVITEQQTRFYLLLFVIYEFNSTRITKIKFEWPGANLINDLAAIFKPAWVLILVEAYFLSYKKVRRLTFLPAAQKQPQAVGL